MTGRYGDDSSACDDFSDECGGEVTGCSDGNGVCGDDGGGIGDCSVAWVMTVMPTVVALVTTVVA
jgi:hypothetical protein